MKLHFEPDLEYQLQAIEAVCDLFRGQELCRTEFTVTRDPADAQTRLGFAQNDLGLGNRLTLLDDTLLANLRAVQLRNGLAQSEALLSGDFTVEMETGTGKTYVYLRTIFELNRRYGFTKFVIVVPSVAIKEGVYKSLEITEEHFKGLYAGVPFDYFTYDSGKLGQVRNFATSAQIQIMVVTVGAINKKEVNNLYKGSEKTGGEKPIDLIRATCPVVIVDEPQTVDGGLSGAGKEALDAMNPLCTLRYSATHIDKHHMVYRLDAVDAYEKQLVKQIEVAAGTVADGHNRPFLQLEEVKAKKGQAPYAKVLVDVEIDGEVKRVSRVVQDGDDLEQTTGRALYANHRIGTISTTKAKSLIELQVPGDTVYLKVGESYGGVKEEALARQMIARTIKEHLDKERRLRPKGIKVLSLFFVDAVEKYRTYGEDGSIGKGEYADFFEAEYKKLAKHPDYATLFAEVDLAAAASEVHNGYFSRDKKGKWVDTADNNEGNRENAERAYNLIMKDKEKLLGLDEPLKFIFSHSALKEGWDNPNVFQICVLRDMKRELTRRQTIGRGLRLCVDQSGQRIRGFDVNTLTVVGTESYESFAERLQQEIEKDTGIKFGVVEKHNFAGIQVQGTDSAPAALGYERSAALWQFLRDKQLIAGNGKVTDELRKALQGNTLPLPEGEEGQREAIAAILRKIAGRIEVKNADERRTLKTRAGVLDSTEFRSLWERVRDKTTYRVDFDAPKLIADCTKALQELPPVPRTNLWWRKAELAIGKGGVEAIATSDAAPIALDDAAVELPDVLTVLQDATQLTRRSLCKILIDSGRLADFKKNPQRFIEDAISAINRCKRLAVVAGIKYERIGDSAYYAQELFQENEVTGYVKNMLMETKKSVYEQVVYDSSTIEKPFAEDLERNEAVKFYAKLPGWFTVPTPLGSYNPDWVILVEAAGAQKLYFVVETKGSALVDDLRTVERAKVECGKAHFKALQVRENPARYLVATSVSDVLASEEN